MSGQKYQAKYRIIPTTLLYLESPVGGSLSSSLTNCVNSVGVHFTFVVPTSNPQD